MTLGSFFESLGQSEAHKRARAQAMHLLVTGAPAQLQTACGQPVICWYPTSHTGLVDDADRGPGHVSWVIGLTLEKGEVFGCTTCERVARDQT